MSWILWNTGSSSDTQSTEWCGSDIMEYRKFQRHTVNRMVCVGHYGIQEAPATHGQQNGVSWILWNTGSSSDTQSTEWCELDIMKYGKLQRLTVNRMV